MIAVLLAAFLAAEAPDLSSPRSAARSFIQAVQSGDGDAIRAIMLAEDEQQEKLAQAFTDLIVSGRKLGEAAGAKFGAAGVALGRGMIGAEDLDRINHAEITEENGVASLLLPGQTRPMKFRSIQGKWKLIVMDYAGAAPEQIPAQIELLRGIAGALSESAREIESGKFSTAPEAEEAIQQKLNAVMIHAVKPTTRPGK